MKSSPILDDNLYVFGYFAEMQSVRKKKEEQIAMGGTGSAKQAVARIASILKECFQRHIPVKIVITVSTHLEKSKLLDSIIKTERASEFKARSPLMN